MLQHRDKNLMDSQQSVFKNNLIESESNLITNKETNLLISSNNIQINPAALQQKRSKNEASKKTQANDQEPIRVTHDNITGAVAGLESDENKKTFGDSTEMKNVKKQLDEVNRVLSSLTIYPGSDLEFEDSLKEVKEAYARLISYAQIYMQRPYPGSKKGQRRYRIVQAALYQAEAELDLLDYNARKKRSEAANLEDNDMDVTFDEILNDLKPQDSSEVQDDYEAFRKTMIAPGRVSVSRMYELLGAKDCVVSAETRYLMVAGKAMPVVLQKKTPDMPLTIAQVREENPLMEISFSDNAKKQLSNIKIINFILGFATEDNDVKCHYTLNGNRIEIDRVMAVNRGFGIGTASQLKPGMRALLDNIKTSGEAVDEEVINSLISVTAREFSELFGGTLKEDGRKALAERIRVFRNEVKNSRIDKELGLNDRRGTSEIVISNISEKGFKEMVAEQRRVNKKNKYSSMIAELRGEVANLPADALLQELFAKVERYANMNVTSVGVQAGRSNVSLENEDALVKEILRDAAALRDQYTQQNIGEQSPKFQAVNKIFTKFDKHVGGHLPDPPAGSYVMDHTGVEPQFTVNDTGVWFSKRDEPLFPHEPTINDVRQGGIGDCFFMGAVCSVVTAHPGLIKHMMKDDGQGHVTVRLFSFEDGGFKPFYIKVNKTVPRRGNRDLYAKDALWVQMLEKAVVASEITRKFKMDFDLNQFFTIDGDVKVPLDYSNPKFQQIMGDVKPGEIEGNGKVRSQGQFQAFIGGFGEAVIPLLTGKFLSHHKTIDYKMYYSDNVYNKLRPAEQNRVNGRARFSGAAKLNEEGEEHVRQLVIEKYGQVGDNFVPMNADQRYINKALYYQFTGKDRSLNVDAKDRAIAVKFVKTCLSYMDRQVPQLEKNVRPSDLYAKLMNSFIKELPNVKEKDKKAFKDFMKTDDFKLVRKYIRNTLKRADVADVARYTLYSGNYYGKALDVYDKIRQGEQQNVPMLAGGTEYLLNKGPHENVGEGEGNSKGLYSSHQYTIHGVREKTFGGKTYKFVLVHNPWGNDGTEYYYNPKNKKLARRQVKNKNKTEGYSYVELSDFMMGYGTVYIGTA